MKKWLGLLLLVGTMLGQAIPDAPSAVKKENPWTAPFKHTEFYVGVGGFAASAIADVHSTTACEHTNPPQCAEAYKGHDRYGYIAPQIALVALGTYGCELMLTDHKWWRRFTCPALGLGWSAVHWKDTFITYPNPRVATR